MPDGKRQLASKDGKLSDGQWAERRAFWPTSCSQEEYKAKMAEHKTEMDEARKKYEAEREAEQTARCDKPAGPSPTPRAAQVMEVW